MIFLKLKAKLSHTSFLKSLKSFEEDTPSDFFGSVSGFSTCAYSNLPVISLVTSYHIQRSSGRRRLWWKCPICPPLHLPSCLSIHLQLCHLVPPVPVLTHLHSWLSFSPCMNQPYTYFCPALTETHSKNIHLFNDPTCKNLNSYFFFKRLTTSRILARHISITGSLTCCLCVTASLIFFTVLLNKFLKLKLPAWNQLARSLLTTVTPQFSWTCENANEKYTIQVSSLAIVTVDSNKLEFV